MKRFLCLVLVTAVFFTTSCKKEGSKKVSSLPVSNSSVFQQASGIVEDYIPTQNEYSTVTQCPVTGDKLKIGKDTKAVKYQGKIYYFCCPVCISTFKSNPGKYAK